jgi:hypothetical protein
MACVLLERGMLFCRMWVRGAVRILALKAMRLICSVFGLICLLASNWPRPLMAAVPPSPPLASPADRAAAQVLFEQGRELMQQKREAEACPRFEESQKLDSGLGTQYHLADCYEAIGRLASAHTLFVEVAARARLRGQDRREKVARERADALEPRLPKLSIDVPPVATSGLLVERDGSPVGSVQWGLAVPVDPGLHRVRVSGPGISTWVAEIEVPSEPAVHTVSVPLLALERSNSFFTPLPHKIGLVALGVGVVALATGGVFAIEASSKNKGSVRAGCSDGSCPDEASWELRRKALTAGDRATWGLGIGLASVASAAVLFWAIPDSDPDAGEGVQLSPVAERQGASLRLAGRF